MLVIGILGLVLTIIWIIFDMKNKSYHEEKVINKAIKTITSEELDAENKNINLSNSKHEVERHDNMGNDFDEDTDLLTELINKNQDINEDTEIMDEFKDKESDDNQTELLTELIENK